ncbi:MULTISPECIES: M1 family metallopeptidase [unclassified Massilia]|uniref:M1 family metallopeptidase n=1 Tax=unclassified Massilia TaxID=2609279 RepID=UPI001781F68A|nr:MULTISPECIES: M1 family metallopeptidase [unclassified Massilia]MBD8531951.1 M1 family metallopeptidase [Massilia sp. CFBP 13647]MBD8675435.1 M1 family metallopeptidase [Massilia sp. CFBP 13721]
MRHPSAFRATPVLALALAVAFTNAPAQAEAPFSFAATPGKLPKDVIPLLYDAHLVPDVKADTFRGTQRVEIEVLRPTTRIVLNAANLAIERASLSGRGMAERVLTPLLDDKQETLTFELGAPLAPGRYVLALAFSGQINREGRGLFQVGYKADGADKKLIATTMEPSDARRMLPTWDEPAFRAKFKLTVDVPASFKAYSNTPVEKQEKLAGGMQRFAFAPTPKMPSYLVVLVAGEMERVAARQDGVEIGVVTTAGKLGATAFPLQATKDLLRYYNNYFGVPYPLAKLDQIAIPGGFNGAMENWGGIVYNESTLLYDPKKSPENVKKLTFEVNAHEVAHQWFGNLVTMAWWDNLWLNEGFASWMASKATEHFHPEWRPYLDGIAEREGVLNLDARKTTHPIQTRIDNEEQAAGAFDSITYVKGQGFLRMLEAYVGEDPFRKGIRAYMAKHQYSNTTTADLWAAIEKASGKPVSKLAGDWTTQPGYPLISVSQACVDGKRQVTLAQEQYRLDEPAPENRLWTVPLQVGTVNGKAWYTLLANRSTTITQGGCEGTLVVDPHSVGFFRIQYDRASFDALAANAARLPDPTRLKLLTDTWSLVAAGRMQLDAYMALVAKYGDEPRLAVWQSILGNLGTLDNLARGEPEQALIRRFVIGFVQPRFAQLGWEPKAGEAAEERQLRALLASSLARAGDEGAIREARQRFARFQVDPASVSPEMLDFVVSTVGRYADGATYAALGKQVAAARTDEERNRFGGAMTLVQDPALAASALNMAVSPEIPANLSTMIVSSIGREHPDQAWEFAVAHREALLKSADAVGRNRALASVVAGSSDARHADMMEQYVGQNFGPDALVEARRVGNGIRVRAAQKARLLPQVRAALQTQQQ